MRKKITVSIGIPVYNEEANINNLLYSVLSQKQRGFEVKEIIVVSDGSSDSTINEVKRIKNKKIKLILDKERKGKACRVNQLLKKTNGNILILIDGDCVLENNALTEMVKMFRKEKNLGLIVGEQIPDLRPGLIEKTLFARENILRRIRRTWKEGENVYSFVGRFLGLKNSFAKRVNIPSTVGTDAYLYFSAKDFGFSVAYCRTAVAKFSLPINLQDHFKQSLRFIASQKKMKKYFGEGVENEYQVPKSLFFRVVVQEFFKNPFYTSTFFFFFLLSRTLAKLRNFEQNGIWDIAQSSKRKLINNLLLSSNWWNGN